MMKDYLPNIPVLATAQLFMMTALTSIVSTTALVGYSLASDKSLATLPYALMFIAAMFVSAPASLLMQYVGRRKGFILAAIFGIGGAAICGYSILNQNFYLFCLGSFSVGIFNAFAQYFRFVAADSVLPQKKSRAVSYVLAAGVIAAFFAPMLIMLTKDWWTDFPFAGTYASLVIIYLAVLLVITFLKSDQPGRADKNREISRPLIQIVTQPIYMLAVLSATLGYATMSLIMTASPLAMQHHAIGLHDSSFVIQWHVIGMFAPSFFTGALIQRYGTLNIILLGCAFSLASILINISGTHLNHFWLGLFLLGIGWNFVFIGATTLLTDSYHHVERFKAQAFNDAIVFSTVAFAALSSGKLQHVLGWNALNLYALPGILMVMILIVRYQYRVSTRQIPV